jgi:hypothetical protein
LKSTKVATEKKEILDSKKTCKTTYIYKLVTGKGNFQIMGFVVVGEHNFYLGENVSHKNWMGFFWAIFSQTHLNGADRFCCQRASVTMFEFSDPAYIIKYVVF